MQITDPWPTGRSILPLPPWDPDRWSTRLPWTFLCDPPGRPGVDPRRSPASRSPRPEVLPHLRRLRAHLGRYRLAADRRTLRSQSPPRRRGEKEAPCGRRRCRWQDAYSLDGRYRLETRRFSRLADFRFGRTPDRPAGQDILGHSRWGGRHPLPPDLRADSCSSTDRGRSF